MTSTVSTKGQTVVPKELRERFRITAGTTLDWQEQGDSLRVVKLQAGRAGAGLRWLQRLGRVPAAARDRRAVERA